MALERDARRLWFRRNPASSLITPKEIAVVMQGPIFRPVSGKAGGLSTAAMLAGVRRALPGAQVVLSTWEGEETGGLGADVVVKSQDPGQVLMLLDGGSIGSNVNRQIVSAQAGIAAVERPYTLKSRTDLELRHAGFLRHFGAYPARAAELRLFEERILVLDHYSVDPTRGRPHPFHVSDMVGFGRTSDVRKQWDVPHVSTPAADFEAAQGLPGLDLARPAMDWLPEQYIWTACLRAAGASPPPGWDSGHEETRRISELALANNFVVLRRGQFGARLPKHPLNLAKWGTLYSFADWLSLYRHHCGGAEPARKDLPSRIKDFVYPRAGAGDRHAAPRRLLRYLLVRVPFVTELL